jgi:hypothetical protein
LASSLFETLNGIHSGRTTKHQESIGVLIQY